MDAIVLLGTGMPTLGPIKSAAGTEGPAVLSSMLALAWRTIATLDGREPEKNDLRRWTRGEVWADRFDRQVVP